MFIPVLSPPHVRHPTYTDQHVALERVEGFCKNEGVGSFIITTAETEHYISEKTFDLLKSLTLRP